MSVSKEPEVTIMPDECVTQYLFVDASVFRHRQFDFGSKAFRSLLDLARHGDAKILTTSITISECKRLIRTGVQEAMTAL